ncbi:Deoxycytidine monophosphate (dCMP) deaminase [Kappamyces sp. JEL0680]|nr:Deoxycytidine monophosphate (dCMP) deaminase [Kappamyces sp. JEL0680]
MLVGIVGPRFSGKKTLAAYLIETHGFQLLEVTGPLASPSDRQFATFSDAVNYATSHWRCHFVMLNIQKYADFEIAFKRPFFLLVCVQAPTLVRYQRNQKYGGDDVTLCDLQLSDHGPSHKDSRALEMPLVSLEAFLALDEADLYQTIHNPAMDYSLYDFMRKAAVSVFNDGDDIPKFHQAIEKLQLSDPQHTRPSWDTYFMALCELASKRSNCMKRRVGCILVSESRVLSTGYNGTPKNVRNCNQGGCPRCNGNASCGAGLDNCICIHAEENALLEVGRDRISHQPVTLYCNTCPCLGCAKKIVQVGIREVVYAQDYGMDDLTKSLLVEAGVTMRKIDTLAVAISHGAMNALNQLH